MKEPTRPLALAAALLVVGAVLVAGGVATGIVAPGSDATEPAPIEFSNATVESGLQYDHTAGSSAGHGDAGVFVADVTNDGYPDVVTTGGDHPALWRNEGGTFTRAESFPELSGSIKSATVIDYDDDGWQDVIFFPTYSEPVALHNEEGTFERDDVGLGNHSYVLGAAPGDVTGDGLTDLLVYQSGDWKNGKPEGYFGLDPQVPDDNGNPNVLYRNVGGEFERVEDAGITGDHWSLAASLADLNGDGRLDVHVANDFYNDVIYWNEGDGTFERQVMANVTARNGMSSQIGDVDGNGRPDVFVTNIELPIRSEMGQERFERLKWFLQFELRSNRTDGNTLSVNRGDGTFEERAEEFGVQTGGWGWAASHRDLNNDGRNDLLHATENRVRIDEEDPVYTYPMVWERTADGFAQRDASEIGFGEDDGRGLVTLDYDRDGDMDVISAAYGERFGVYENVGAPNASALQLLAVDDSGAPADGAEVVVDTPAGQQTHFQHSRSDFMSLEAREVHVGLGDREATTVRVTWPDGTERTFSDVGAGQYVHLRKNGAVETVVEFDD